MGQQIVPAEASCCRSEAGGSKHCEVQLWELSDQPDAPHSFVQLHTCRLDPPDLPDRGLGLDDLDCCREVHDDSEELEGLSYQAVRFDANSTADAGRSSARYSKIVVHSSRARTQRRSKAWEEWLRSATAGRKVTLVTGAGFPTPRSGCTDEDLPDECQKIEVVYRLDSDLTKMTICPSGSTCGDEDPKPPPITILLNNIQVVCPLTEFMMLSEKMEAQLDECERSRATMIQYLSENNTSTRVCFLEEDEFEKDRCVQALTALWLEKRNDHSMWF